MRRHRRLLTRQEAWQRLNVSESTLDRWRRSGFIPDIAVPGRTVRIDPDAIDAIRFGYLMPSGSPGEAV